MVTFRAELPRRIAPRRRRGRSSSPTSSRTAGAHRSPRVVAPCRSRGMGRRIGHRGPVNRTRSPHTPCRERLPARRSGNPQCSPLGRAQASARLAALVARPFAAPARERARPSAVRGPVDSPPCKRHRPFSGAGSPGLHTAAARHARPSRHFAPQRGRSSVAGRLRATRARSVTPAIVAFTLASVAAMLASNARSMHESHSPHEHGRTRVSSRASATTSSDPAARRASRSAVFRSNARRRFIVGGRLLTLGPSTTRYPVTHARARP